MSGRFFLHFQEMPKGTAQQKGVRVIKGKPTFYRKNKIETSRFQFALALRPHAPKAPTNKNVRLELRFYYNVKDKALWGKPKPTRPDCDNLAKEFIDAMKDAGFFTDDSRVSDLHITKSYSERATIVVSWSEVDDA